MAEVQYKNNGTWTILNNNASALAARAGIADSADKWTTARSISLTGNVNGSVSGVDGSSNISISTTIADNAITSTKISNKAVSLAKLADEIQTVYVGTNEPTDAHVTIWIEP